jgi:8-oxo-dGTP diphosphatase
MTRTVRFQGAIVHEHQLLLIQHREHASGHSYGLLPGGGQEEGESEEDCVVREMREETGLEVQVERLLLDEPAVPVVVYQRRKTYLCRIMGGAAAPGYEPEEEVAELIASWGG